MKGIVSRIVLRQHLRRFVQQGKLGDEEKQQVRRVLRNLPMLKALHAKVEEMVQDRAPAERVVSGQGLLNWLWDHRAAIWAIVQEIIALFS